MTKTPKPPVPTGEVRLETLGELKRHLKFARKVYVWTNWEVEDGAYVEVSKTALLVGIMADEPWSKSGHGGRLDSTTVRATFRNEGEYDRELYVG